jgi:hypothetical protein
VIVGVLGDGWWMSPDAEANAQTKKFVEAYKARFGDYPVFPSMKMANAILYVKAAYEAAMKKNGGKWPARDEIVGAMHGSTVTTLTGVTIALAKQLCGKPIGRQLWFYADVEGHWDDLVLRSWAAIDGTRVLYQESAVSSLRTPRDLIRKFASADTLPPGMLMFCGTPGAIGGIRPAARFEMELHDPVLNRSLTHAYDVEVLPVIS